MKKFFVKFWKFITAGLVLVGLWFFGIIDFGRDRMVAVEQGLTDVASTLERVNESLDGRLDVLESPDDNGALRRSEVDGLGFIPGLEVNSRIDVATTDMATNASVDSAIATATAPIIARLDVLEGSGDQGAVRLGAYRADRAALEQQLADFVTSDQLQPIQAQLQGVAGVSAEECLAALDVQTQSVAAASCGDTQVTSPLPGCVCRVTPSGDATCEGTSGLAAELETETRRRRYADRQLREALEALEQAQAAPTTTPAAPDEVAEDVTVAAPSRGVIIAVPVGDS